MRYTVRPILIAAVLLLSGMSAVAAEQPLVDSHGQILLADNDGPGRGRWRDRRDEARGGNEDRVIPLDSIINSLMSVYPGKPLDARGPMQRADRLIYEIVWLTRDGRQIVIIVDARTGQVMRVRGL